MGYPTTMDGEPDRVERCAACGEDIVMDTPGDEESWIHAEWANDDAKHTAEREE